MTFISIRFEPHVYGFEQQVQTFASNYKQIWERFVEQIEWEQREYLTKIIKISTWRSFQKIIPQLITLGTRVKRHG